VDKDIESAKQIIEERKQELTNMAKDLQGEMEKASAAINSLALEIDNMSKAAQAKDKPKE
jgi:prefoldin subunit 5